MKKIIKTYGFPIIFLCCFCLPLILPYFRSGFFPTHDGEWAVVRLSEMYRELKDLQFPARFSGVLNHGYGYPLFNFVYPLPYYVGVFFVFSKLGFITAIKILFVLSVFFSAIGMYLLSKDTWKNIPAGIISALFYIYLPYRIVDLYVRGSLGESFAFALFPFLLLAIKKIFDKKNITLPFFLTALLFAALIMSHNIMSVLFLPIILVFVSVITFFKISRKTILILLSLGFGLLLSAFFWLPALFEKQYILLSKIPIADRDLYFVQFQQLFLPRWGYEVPTATNGFSYQLGWPHMLVLGGVVVFFLLKLKEKKQQHMVLSLLLVIISMILLLFPFSAVVWKYTPLLSEINYPWILLGPLGFLMSLLAGVLWKKNKLLRIFLVGSVIAAIILVIPYARPKEYYPDKKDEFYTTNEATTTSSNELMPLWVISHPQSRFEEKAQIIKGSGIVSATQYQSNKISFSANNASDTIIRVNTIYFPGWNVRVDGKTLPMDYQNSMGVIDIAVTKGQHTILAEFENTIVRTISNALSVIAFFLLILFIVRKKIPFLS